MDSGDQQKTSTTKIAIIIVLLALTLPLTYMLFARVILPLLWDEQNFSETTVQPAPK